MIEEKASLVENQIKDICFNWPADRRPSVCGKAGLDGVPLITALGQHRPATLARPIATAIPLPFGALAMMLLFVSIVRRAATAGQPLRAGATLAA